MKRRAGAARREREREGGEAQMGRPDGLIAIFVGDGTRRHKDVTGAWRAARLIILTSVVEAGCSYDNLEISLY